MRAKLPRGRGTWPAIWMLPVRGEYAKGGWPDNGEIDIMEHVGFDPGVIHGTIHTRAYNHVDRTQRGATTTVADAQDAFHVYGSIGRASRSWSTSTTSSTSRSTTSACRIPRRTGGSGRSTRTSASSSIVAVGGNWGGQKGVDESIWPQRLEIDYVRVFELKR